MAKKKTILTGLGAALVAVASVVTLGLIKKNKNKEKEQEKEEE